MVSASTLIRYQTHTGHTGTNRLTHIYKHILTPPVTCTQTATYTALKKITKIYFAEVENVFAFQKLLTCGSHISADYIQKG